MHKKTRHNVRGAADQVDWLKERPHVLARSNRSGIHLPRLFTRLHCIYNLRGLAMSESNSKSQYLGGSIPAREKSAPNDSVTIQGLDPSMKLRSTESKKLSTFNGSRFSDGLSRAFSCVPIKNCQPVVLLAPQYRCVFQKLLDS